jgi:glutaredoxin
MYQLYTSNTCPKGEAAGTFLRARRVDFTAVNLDEPADEAAEHRLRLLIRAALHDDQADVMLPVLVQDEQLISLGFDPIVWEEKLGSK